MLFIIFLGLILSTKYILIIARSYISSAQETEIVRGFRVRSISNVIESVCSLQTRLFCHLAIGILTTFSNRGST